MAQTGGILLQLIGTVQVCSNCGVTRTIASVDLASGVLICSVCKALWDQSKQNILPADAVNTPTANNDLVGACQGMEN